MPRRVDDQGNTNYLGYCSKCKKYGAIGAYTDLCRECRIEEIQKAPKIMYKGVMYIKEEFFNKFK